MLEFHPFAELFPPLGGADLEELVEDIRINGVRQPIDMLDGKILDGRNRYRALVTLRVRASPCGPGWGALQGEPLSDDELIPAHDTPWFRTYSPMESGDPLKYVLSLNLKRRHLSDTQRASVAAKIANLGRGRPAENVPDGTLTADEAAEQLNVSRRQVLRARVVHEQGVPELRQALDEDKLPVATAEKIARMPEQEQRAAVEQAVMPSNARAVMASRQEPSDSLDYYPTPPWATRALLQCALPHLGIQSIASVWEPACGEGHMTGVLEESVPKVIGTDIFDYSADGRSPPAWLRQQDFLDAEDEAPAVDWIITNPPFEDKALAFVLRALELAEVGVAMFFPLRWLETPGRYNALFKPKPPTLVAPFVERVPLYKGHWEPEGGTATAYMWLVWVRDMPPQPVFWIPPGQREALALPHDVERFTAQPVLRLPRPLVMAEGSVVDISEIGRPDGIVRVAPRDGVVVGIDFGKEPSRTFVTVVDGKTGEVVTADAETGEIVEVGSVDPVAEAARQADKAFYGSEQWNSESPPAANSTPASGNDVAGPPKEGESHETQVAETVVRKTPGEVSASSSKLDAIQPAAEASPLPDDGEPATPAQAAAIVESMSGITPELRGVQDNADGLDIPPFMRRPLP